MTRLLSVLSVTLLLAAASPVARAAQDRSRDDLPERDEQHMTVELSAGAMVEISDISGTVDIETTQGGPAQIDIVRSARSQKDLQRGQIEVEHTPSRLAIHTKSERNNWEWGHNEVRQRIMLKIPRDVSLRISDISGHVSAGDVDGSANVSDISGRVKLGQVGETSTVTDISGGVEMTVARLGGGGLRVSDISGSVDVYFAAAVNANLHVSDVSGNVSVDLPDLSVVGKINSDDYRATIGSGGPQIEISDISGHVRLSPAGER